VNPLKIMLRLRLAERANLREQLYAPDRTLGANKKGSRSSPILKRRRSLVVAVLLVESPLDLCQQILVARVLERVYE
jgi:hypothetical protein